jgi:endonuclease III
MDPGSVSYAAHGLLQLLSNGMAPSKRESAEARRERALTILRILRKEFPEARTALLHHSPFQLLISTILSAQCTDERVNKVTPGLFQKYPGPADFARADLSDLEREIRSTGFFRMKSRNIVACSQALLDRHQGIVPETIDEMVKLPGVGRKTANVVLGQAFGKDRAGPDGSLPEEAVDRPCIHFDTPRPPHVQCTETSLRWLFSQTTLSLRDPVEPLPALLIYSTLPIVLQF